MKVVGFITEYNPFHYGHKYHLEKAKEITNATHTIAVMSGSFVQRGEPSFVDKWTKAKMAVDNGVDLVIELPFLYSVQSAELFAFGGVSILNALDAVDYIAFGVEDENLEVLLEIAEILTKEPIEFKNTLKEHLNQGLSYSASRSSALESYIKSKKPDSTISYSSILKKSNNILAIEYLKSLIKLNSNVKPAIIRRQGDNYNDVKIISSIASATGIRNTLLEKKDLVKVKDYLPEASYMHLTSFYNNYQKFNYLSNYNSIIQYMLRTVEINYLREIMDMEIGLENRILNLSKEFYDIELLVEAVKTKRYPSTRIKRIMIHLLNDLKEETVKKIYNNPIEYVRVLGSNKKGLEILNHIKSNTNLSIITKFADYEKINNDKIKEMLNYEKKATDIYFLGIENNKPLLKMDYLTSPYIRN